MAVRTEKESMILIQINNFNRQAINGYSDLERKSHFVWKNVQIVEAIFCNYTESSQASARIETKTSLCPAKEVA